VQEFKERVPELAQGLDARIKKAHKDSPRFETAFGNFFELCQQMLNPNIRRDAVDEILVQHLLTKRLFRTFFDDPDFTRRNVIAAEIEATTDTP
jgi:predicted helicase